MAHESNSLFAQPPKKPALGAGPSALTARLQFNLQTSLEPSASMRFIAPTTTTTTTSAPPKRSRDMTAVSEDEGDRQRRRHERNLREQERSRRITEQITYLREVLSDANVPCKPDKNSTLISVADYIRQLQDRSSLLDNEHKKLLDTIARTNEMVNNQYYQATVGGTSVSPSVSSDLLSDANIARNLLEDENAVFVQGLDYKNVFKRCAVALAIASVDGRFMDCNEEFEKLSGYSRNELLPATGVSTTEVEPDVAPSASTTLSSEHPPRNLSLFNLLTHEDMEQVFMAMSGMLRSPVGSRPNAPPVTSAAPHQDYWCGVVRQNREHNSTVRP
jgi:PAS domain-containing protein